MPTIKQLEKKLKKVRQIADARRKARRAIVDEKILRIKLMKDIRQAENPNRGIFLRIIKQASKDAVRVGKTGIKAGKLINKDLAERQKAREEKEKKTVKKRPVKRRAKKRTTHNIGRNQYY